MYAEATRTSSLFGRGISASHQVGELASIPRKGTEALAMVSLADSHKRNNPIYILYCAIIRLTRGECSQSENLLKVRLGDRSHFL